MTADLLAFLNARVNEDERIAAKMKAVIVAHHVIAIPGAQRICCDGGRLLREVEAKRKRIAILAGMLEGPPSPQDGPEAAIAYRLDVARATALLRLEAAPYDQHPDFQEEWRA